MHHYIAMHLNVPDYTMISGNNNGDDIKGKEEIKVNLKRFIRLKKEIKIKTARE